jgi:hypothetical protein
MWQKKNVEGVMEAKFHMFLGVFRLKLCEGEGKRRRMAEEKDKRKEWADAVRDDLYRAGMCDFSTGFVLAGESDDSSSWVMFLNLRNGQRTMIKYEKKSNLTNSQIHCELYIREPAFAHWAEIEAAKLAYRMGFTTAHLVVMSGSAESCSRENWKIYLFLHGICIGEICYGRDDPRPFVKPLVISFHKSENFANYARGWIMKILQRLGDGGLSDYVPPNDLKNVYELIPSDGINDDTDTWVLELKKNGEPYKTIRYSDTLDLS